MGNTTDHGAMKFWALVSKFSETRFFSKWAQGPLGRRGEKGERLDLTSRLAGPGQAIVRWYNTALSRPTTILRKGLASLLNFEPTTTSQDNSFFFFLWCRSSCRSDSFRRLAGRHKFILPFSFYFTSLFRTTHPLFLSLPLVLSPGLACIIGI